VRNRLIRLLRWLAFLLEKNNTTLLLRAIELVVKFDSENQSGEWKRHQVYSRLLKEFVNENKREISKAIEEALNLCT